MTTLPKGQLIVMTGPSGVGKGLLRSKITPLFPMLKTSISATTRRPRSGEVEGSDYFFVERARFEEMIRQDELLEWAEFAGNCYGTPVSFVQQTLDTGDSVLLELEVQGALAVKDKFPDARLVFIAPPSLAVLEERLRKRDTDEEASILSRLETAKWEISQQLAFEAVIVNDDAEVAAAELQKRIETFLNIAHDRE